MRTFRRVFVALLLLNVAVIWVLPFFPAQDLPQHLAYVRILADYDDPTLRFSEFYLLPERFQSYFTTYYLLAAIARVTSVAVAIRLLLSLYVVLLFFSFDRLVAELHAQFAPNAVRWTSLLVALFVWSPVAIMGFLQFLVAIPIFVAGVAALVRLHHTPQDRGARILLAAAAALLTSVHLVAAGALILFALLLFPFGRRLVTLAIPTGATAGVVTLFALVGETGVVSRRLPSFAEAVRGAHGLEAINHLFGITWYDLPVRTSYTLWTVLGPYRWPGLLFSALLLGALAIVLSRRRARPDHVGLKRMFLRVALLFALVTWLLPWGLTFPEEITFLNFRLLTLAFIILVATLDPRWFQGPARHAVTLCAFAFTLHFAVNAWRFQSEARQVDALLEKVEPDRVLQTLVFSNASDHFSTQFRITHFLPMYFTVKRGGITTQFWARYTHHLPIAYRDGKKPPHAPDWRPHEFHPRFLASADYLLIQHASREDRRSAREASKRVRDQIANRTQLVGCEGRWCLHRITP